MCKGVREGYDMQDARRTPRDIMFRATDYRSSSSGKRFSISMPFSRRHMTVVLIILHLSCCAPKQPGPQIQDGVVRFSLWAPRATSAAIAGSFNRWDRRANALSGPDKRGVWTTTLTLPEGRHEYLFVVDGVTWLPDPGAPSVDDGFGGRNSIVEVGR
jgi:hypothetical protein